MGGAGEWVCGRERRQDGANGERPWESGNTGQLGNSMRRGAVEGLADRGESKEDTTKVVGKLFVEQVMCLAAGGVQRVGE